MQHRLVATGIAAILLAACGPPPRRDPPASQDWQGGGGDGHGGRGFEGGSADLVLGDATAVIHDGDGLRAVTEDGVLRFDADSRVAGSLEAGQVVIAGITDASPRGLLRRITALRSAGDRIDASTEPAALADAIESGAIRMQLDFSKDHQKRVQPLMAGVHTEVRRDALTFEEELLLVFDGTRVADGVYLDGRVSLGVGVDIEVDIDWFKVERILFRARGSEQVRLAVRSGSGIRSSHALPPIEPVRFAPVQIPGTPLVVVPHFTVILEVEGQGRLGGSALIEQAAEAVVGIEYKRDREKRWAPISDFTNTFDFAPPRAFGSGVVTGKATGRLTFELYDVGGPSLDARAYVTAASQNGVRSLAAGFDVRASAVVAIFGRTVAELPSLVLYEARKELFREASPPSEGEGEGEGPGEGEGEGEDCRSDAPRICDGQDLQVWDSCGRHQRTIQCDHGCEMGASECASPTGEGEGEGASEGEGEVEAECPDYTPGSMIESIRIAVEGVRVVDGGLPREEVASLAVFVKLRGGRAEPFRGWAPALSFWGSIADGCDDFRFVNNSEFLCSVQGYSYQRDWPLLFGEPCESLVDVSCPGDNNLQGVVDAACVRWDRRVGTYDWP